jgi:hypothetical protein
MTGVVNVRLPAMRFTAYCEVLGLIGLILPYATGVLPILTPLAAIGLGVIMVLAARIHLGLGEPAPAVAISFCWRCAFSFCWRCAFSWHGDGGRDESPAVACGRCHLR